MAEVCSLYEFPLVNNIWVICFRNILNYYYRSGINSSNPGGVAWVQTGGSFIQLDAGMRGDVYAVDKEGQMYTREGTRPGNPQGYKWSKVGNERFLHVSVGEKFVLGIHHNTFLYVLP